MVGLPTLNAGRRFAAPLLAALLAVSNLAYPAPLPVAAVGFDENGNMVNALPTEVEEILYTEPNCVAPTDTTVTVSGRNFEPNAELLVANLDTEDEETITTDEFGNFSGVVLGIAPPDSGGGSFNYLYADYTEGGNGADIYYQECTPRFEVTPDCGATDAITEIDVHGTGWDVDSTDILVELYDSTNELITTTSIESPTETTFDVTLTIPEGDSPLADGEYRVHAEQGLAPTMEWDMPVMVPCPSVAIGGSAAAACLPVGGPPDTWSIDVYVAGFVQNPSDYNAGDGGYIDIVFDPDGNPQEFWTDEPDDGFYNIRPFQRGPGTYTILVKQGYDKYNWLGTNHRITEATTTITVPCAEDAPVIYITPDCGNVGATGEYFTLTVHGRNFEPGRDVRIVDDFWDPQFLEPAVRTATPDDAGAFTQTFAPFEGYDPEIYLEPEDLPHPITARYTDDLNTVLTTVYFGVCEAEITVTSECQSGPTSIDVAGQYFFAGVTDPFPIDVAVDVYSLDGGGSLGGNSISGASSSWSMSVTFDGSLSDGAYRVVAVSSAASFGTLDTAETYFVVPCPTLTVTPDCSAAGAPPATLTLNITTAGFLEGDGFDGIEIVFDAPDGASAEAFHSPQEWHFASSNGAFEITPYQRAIGDYTVVAKQGYDFGGANRRGDTHRTWVSAEVAFNVECTETAQPMLYVTPDCVTDPDGESPSPLRVHGRNFPRNTDLGIWHQGENQLNDDFVVTTSNFGTFDVTFEDFVFDLGAGFSEIAAYSDDGTFTFFADVTVTPCVAQIELTTKCASGATSIEVNGSGFETGPDYFVALYVYDLADDELISQAEIVARETFTASVEFDGDSYPGGLPDGQYIVYAELTSDTESVFQNAQTFFLAPCPTVTVQPICAPAGSPPSEMSLMVTTSGFLEWDPFTGPDLSNQIEIVFDNPATPAEEALHEPQEWVIFGPPNATFTINPYFRPNGTYRVTAKQGYGTGTSNGGAFTHRVWSSDEVTFNVPCPGPTASDPLLYTTPDCLDSTTEQTIAVHGRNFERSREVEIIDRGNSDTTVATFTSDYGTFNVDLSFLHESGAYHYIYAQYTDDPGTELAYVILADCEGRITATPKCDVAPTSISVVGSGFNPESEYGIEFLVRDVNLQVVGSTSIGPTDTFEVSIPIDSEAYPAGLPDGEYGISAQQGPLIIDSDSFETDAIFAFTYFVAPCPTITIEPICGPAGFPPDTYSISVTASGFLASEGLDRLEIVFDAGGAEPQEFVTEAANGTFVITPLMRPGMSLYAVTAKQGYYRGEVFSGIALFVFPGATNTQWTEATTYFAVPCLPDVTQFFISVDCGPPAPASGEPGVYEITVSGFGWLPGGVYVYFDADEVAGPANEYFFDVSSEGTFTALITPTQRPLGTYRIEALQHYFDQPISVSAFFTVPCVTIAPLIELDPQCGPPQLVGDEDRNYELTLTGSGYAPGPLTIIFDADAAEEDQQVFESEVDALGNFVATITPLYMPEGEYRIAGIQFYLEELVESEVIFFVPCAPALPELTIDPACGPVVIGDDADEPSYEINVMGTAFLPGPVDIYFDFAGDLELFTATADQDGLFQAVITPTGRTAGIYDIVAQQEVAFSGTLVEAAGVFVVDCEGPLMRVVQRSAPRGLVVRVEGFNFPAETTLNLFWDRGIAASRPIETPTDADGSFVRFVLIFRSDFPGLRNLTAALPDDPEAFVGVTAPHLVLLGTIQPPFTTDNPFALPDASISTRR